NSEPSAPATISDNIYTTLYSSYPCTKIMTSDGQFGCSSKHGGNSGILYLIDDDESYNNYFSYSQQKDIIVVLDTNYFNSTSVLNLHNKSKIEGIIVLTDTKKTYPYSPDSRYPNKIYGLYPNSNLEWNPNADGFTYFSFPFPIFAIDNQTSVAIRNVSKHNRDGQYPAWGAELDSFMQGAINSETCLRRGFCEPVGGQSIWSSFSSKIDKEKEIILVMLPFDTTAFFRDLSIGADQSSFATVTLLSVIKSLAAVDRSSWNKEVVFAFWNAERWGYVGSEYFINDLLNFQCKTYNSDKSKCIDPPRADLAFQTQINFTKISTIIELNQIGRAQLDKNLGKYSLYLHTAGTKTSSVTDILDQVASSYENSTITFKPTTQTELPPSSSMSFLKKTNKIPVVVITDHDYKYSNPYYGYEQDDNENVLGSTLNDIVYILSTFIDRIAGGNNNITIDKNFINILYPCFTSSITCFNILMKTYPLNEVPNFYSSVFGTSLTTTLSPYETKLIHRLLYSITQYNSTLTNCTSDNDCPSSLCYSGQCVSSNTHLHNALSLGFDFDTSKNVWKIVNSSYPIFTESNWDYTALKVFKIGNSTTE
nr:Chain A, Crystal structure of the gamma-secretase component Nicastrin [Dictyostelium purpureum]